MNNAPQTNSKQGIWRLLALIILLVLCLWITQRSIRELAKAKAPAPEVVSVARKQLKDQEGRWFWPERNEPFTGLMTDASAEGVLRLRTAVKDGWLDGESEGWFTNGVREVREEFSHGVAHGIRITWYANGQKRSEGHLAAGLQEGTYLQWHEDGTLAVEAEFESGKAHGLSRAWYPSGYLQTEALMKHGEIETRHFYPDGDRREPTLIAETLNLAGITSSK